VGTLVTFHAHPDDESIATGGLMAKAADAGHRVVLVLATRGEHGEPVPDVLGDGEVLADRRSEEAVDAARILGADTVEFLGYHDSGMMGEPTNDLDGSFWRADVGEAAARLADVLRAVDADVLTIYDAHGGYGHPDHIQVHRVGSEAARLAGVAHVYEATMNRTQILESLAADPDMIGEWDEEEMRTFGTPVEQITEAVDVSGLLARKREAMIAHRSQIGPDSFFLMMAPEVFAVAFGVEWYVRHGADDHTTGPTFVNLLPGLSPS
jgi:LmbE family N-acetylglucosaminyl deacetylase